MSLEYYKKERVTIQRKIEKYTITAMSNDFRELSKCAVHANRKVASSKLCPKKKKLRRFRNGLSQESIIHCSMKPREEDEKQVQTPSVIFREIRIEPNRFVSRCLFEVERTNKHRINGWIIKSV